MRDSRFALGVIIVVSFAVAVLGGRDAALSYGGDWARGGSNLSPAGWWYVLVSLPVLHLVRLRWLWRMLVWWRLLFGLARLPLRLMPAHPDRAGGLGFLSNVAGSFALLVFALCVGFGFDFRALIVRGSATLETLTVPMVGLPLLMLVWMLAPLAFFLPQLKAAKGRGKAVYGQLAARYTRQFDARWLGPADRTSGELLGTADIQSLADLANSYDVVVEMRLVPLATRTAITLVLAAAVAMLPAVAAQIPLKEILLKVLTALR
jgi:hypothetical protein